MQTFENIYLAVRNMQTFESIYFAVSDHEHVHSYSKPAVFFPQLFADKEGT